MLEAPEQNYASEPAVPRRRTVAPARKLRQDFSDDFADDFDDDDDAPVARRRAGTRVRFRGLPTTKWGRIAVGVAFVVLIGVCAGVAMVARNMLLHDDRFVIQSSSSIEIEGNSHLTRAQLLSIFGGDVERNIFNVSLMPADAAVNTHYSFPVVTGILADEPLSVRAARMKIYSRFTSELDGSGEKISQELSEVDLSNPEDVKALIPDHSSEVLVHFGEENFLDRYRKYEAHLAEWRTQYPKLSSVDMRYERQAVLETGPVAPVSSPAAAAPSPVDAGSVAAPAPVTKAPVAAAAHPVTHAPAKAGKPKAAAHHVAAKSGAASKAKAPAAKKPGDVAVWVHPKSGTKRAVTPSTATHPQYHPPQVVHP